MPLQAQKMNMKWPCYGNGRYCKLQRIVNYSTQIDNNRNTSLEHDVSCISCSDEHIKNVIQQDMLIYNDFLSKEEEESLLKEVEPYLKRMRYEYNHWDNVSSFCPGKKCVVASQ